MKRQTIYWLTFLFFVGLAITIYAIPADSTIGETVTKSWQDSFLWVTFKELFWPVIVLIITPFIASWVSKHITAEQAQKYHRIAYDLISRAREKYPDQDLLAMTEDLELSIAKYLGVSIELAKNLRSGVYSEMGLTSGDGKINLKSKVTRH